MLREWLLLAGNAGAWAVFLALLKEWWNRKRLRRFRNDLHDLGQLFFPTDSKDLDEDEWKALTAIFLHDAGFSVAEIEKWLTIGVLMAKAEVSQTLRRVQDQKQEHAHGRNRGSDT